MSKFTVDSIKAIKASAELIINGPTPPAPAHARLASGIITASDTLISIIESEDARRNEYARDLYAAHRDERRAYLREWRAKRKAQAAVIPTSDR